MVDLRLDVNGSTNDILIYKTMLLSLQHLFCINFKISLIRLIDYAWYRKYPPLSNRFLTVKLTRKCSSPRTCSLLCLYYAPNELTCRQRKGYIKGQLNNRIRGVLHLMEIAECCQRESTTESRFEQMPSNRS